MTTLPHSASSSPIGSEPCVTGSATVATVIGGSRKGVELVRKDEVLSMLPRGRRRGVDTIGGGVVARNDGREFALQGPAHGRTAPLGGAEQRVAPIEPDAGF